MSNGDPLVDNLESLILEHFDGTLDAARQQQLAQRMAEDSHARDLFRSYMRLEGLAAEMSLGRRLVPPELAPVERADRRKAAAMRRWPISLALLGSGLACWLAWTCYWYGINAHD